MRYIHSHGLGEQRALVRRGWSFDQDLLRDGLRRGRGLGRGEVLRLRRGQVLG